MRESPFYRFYRLAKFPLPYKVWRKTPRMNSHKNEYFEGCVYLSPRPQTCDVLLPLKSWAAPVIEEVECKRPPLEVAVRKLDPEDWAALPEVFRSAFAQLQPLYGRGVPAASRASRVIMRWTHIGGHGALIDDACFVALARRRPGEPMTLCGCAIVTLVPISYTGARTLDGVPDPENPERTLIPHLDWIFVSARFKRGGVATVLLEEVVRSLRERQFHTLASTFTIVNPESMQWHWRNGFVLPPREWGGSAPMRVEA